jgi:soluble lytic murein transglycosylase-like protein
MSYARRAFLFALVAFAIGLVATPADAQIYSWRDANGVLVLSDRPQAADAVTVAGSDRVRTTRASDSPARSRGLDSIIEQHAASNGVRLDLIRAVIQVESGFNPNARSPKGAMGLMQLMPATAEELGVLNAYDPEQNIRGGVRRGSGETTSKSFEVIDGRRVPVYSNVRGPSDDRPTVVTRPR